MQLSRYWRMGPWLLRLSTEPRAYMTEVEARERTRINAVRVAEQRAKQEGLKNPDIIETAEAPQVVVVEAVA